MDDAQQVLGLNEDISGNQQICMFRNSARKSVLDGNYCPVYRVLLDPVENIRRSCAWHHYAAWQHFFRSFVAKRSQLSLDGDFHMQRKFFERNFIGNGNKRKGWALLKTQEHQSNLREKKLTVMGRPAPAAASPAPRSSPLKGTSTEN
jgi:hypothetical protein